MKDEDIENLLGGFATDTLTDRERDYTQRHRGSG